MYLSNFRFLSQKIFNACLYWELRGMLHMQFKEKLLNHMQSKTYLAQKRQKVSYLYTIKILYLEITFISYKISIYNLIWSQLNISKISFFYHYHKIISKRWLFPLAKTKLDAKPFWRKLYCLLLSFIMTNDQLNLDDLIDFRLSNA